MGAWRRTIEDVIANAERRGGVLAVERIGAGDFHLATGLPLTGSGAIQASVRTGTTMFAARFHAAAAATDFLCYSVSLGNLLKTYDPVHGDPSVLLYASCCQGGSGTASASLLIQADAVWEYGPGGTFTDTNIGGVSVESYGGDSEETPELGIVDDTRVDLVWDLTRAASASDRQLITGATALNVKFHTNEAVAVNQYANLWNAWLVVTQNLRPE